MYKIKQYIFQGLVSVLIVQLYKITTELFIKTFDFFLYLFVCFVFCLFVVSFSLSKSVHLLELSVVICDKGFDSST